MAPDEDEEHLEGVCVYDRLSVSGLKARGTKTNIASFQGGLVLIPAFVQGGGRREHGAGRRPPVEEIPNQ